MNEPHSGFQELRELEAEFTLEPKGTPQSEFGNGNYTNGADQLEKLQQAVVSSSHDVRRAFFMFGAFSLYLIITVGVTTHEQLLRGSVFTLPILAVDIPIVGFYIVVPLLFVFTHLNLIGEFNSLADDAEELKKYLSKSKKTINSTLPFGFCRLFIQPDETRVPRRPIFMITVISAVIFPPLILLAVQIRFLPYHSEFVTTLHRLYLLGDVIVLWLFWPTLIPSWYDNLHVKYRHYDIARTLKNSPWLRISAVPMTALVIVFSWFAATVPDGWAEKFTLAMVQIGHSSAKAAEIAEGSAAADSDNQASCGSLWLPWTYFEPITTDETRPTYLDLGKPLKPRTMPCLTYRLFEAPETWRNLRRNLIVSKANLVAVRPPPDLLVGKLGKDLKDVWDGWGRGLDLRGRDLRFADFTQSDLRLADLRGADLSGAKLKKTKLHYSDLGDISANQMGGCIGNNSIKDTNNARYCFTIIRNTILINTNFQFARLWKADLGGAHIEWPEMTDADLSHTRWRGTVIDGCSWCWHYISSTTPS